MNQALKDFISLQKKPVYNPYFGFFRVAKKGINGTGKYYRNKIGKLYLKRIVKPISKEKLQNRFLKYYEPKMGVKIKTKKNDRRQKTENKS